MLAARNFDAPLDRLIELDVKVRKLQSEKEQLQAERNKASKGGPPTDPVKEQMKKVGDRIRQIDEELVPLTAERDDAALWIPNEIAPGVPPGKDENDNRLVREDPKRDLGFEAKPHWDVGEALGILDIPRGAPFSSSVP